MTLINILILVWSSYTRPEWRESSSAFAPTLVGNFPQVLPYFVVNKLGHLHGLPGMFTACLYAGALRWDNPSSGRGLAISSGGVSFWGDAYTLLRTQGESRVVVFLRTLYASLPWFYVQPNFYALRDRCISFTRMAKTAGITWEQIPIFFSCFPVLLESILKLNNLVGRLFVVNPHRVSPLHSQHRLFGPQRNGACGSWGYRKETNEGYHWYRCCKVVQNHW